MKIVDENLMKKVIKESEKSTRRRALHNLHKSPNELQRMVNSFQPNTYIRPHKHINPKRLESFCILKGKLGILTFEENGEISEKTIIGENYPNKIAEIEGGTYHTVVPLENGVAYEIKEGPYDPETDKTFPDWAPEENTKEARRYLGKLEKIFKEYKSEL